MKKVILLVALLTTLLLQKTFAQDSTTQNQLAHLLVSYYGIKDALTAGDGNSASSQAEAFIKTLNTIDYKTISEGNVNALLKDATPISESRDVEQQRKYFENFSNNMALLAKTVKLSSAPIYQAYCPMKKASWLSPDKTIKNPYFGSSMLSCGRITGTIN